MNNNDNYKILAEKYPFITVGLYSEIEYIGIMQNSSKMLTSLYCFNMIKEQEMCKKFLILGEEWWWNSNRSIPINIFLKPDFDIFKPILKHFNSKDFILVQGPVISLENIIKKRSKKRVIELVKRPK